MKKLFSLVILFILTFSLTACSNNVEANEGEIEFSFPEEYLQYTPYSEVPGFKLEFSETLYTITTVPLPNSRILSTNDDFYLSEVLSELFRTYKDNNRLVVRLINTDTMFETRLNRLVTNKKGNLVHEKEIVRVKNGEIFNEIAHLILENGLMLTIDYRRFIGIVEGEELEFFSWRYMAPINVVLQYPLIMEKIAGENKFLIVPLPAKVIYHIGVSRQLPLDKLVVDDKYLEANFRRFHYPNYSDDPRESEEFDLDANINLVKEFYLDFYNGELTTSNEIKFSYLDFLFLVSFSEEYFEINIIE